MMQVVACIKDMMQRCKCRQGPCVKVLATYKRHDESVVLAPIKDMVLLAPIKDKCPPCTYQRHDASVVLAPIKDMMQVWSLHLSKSHHGEPWNLGTYTFDINSRHL